MVVLLALRFYARMFVTRNLGLDDYLCLLSAATILIYIILLFTILGNPAGPHLWDVPVSKITVYYVQTSVVTALLFMVAAMFIKTAILALYRRIFSPSRRSHIMILSGMAFIVVFYISVLIVMAVGCTPKSEDYALGGWLSVQYSVRCNKYNPATAAAIGLVGAVIDVYILVLPLFFVWKLQTSTKRKAGLAAVFLVGSSACVFSIVSAYYRFNIIATSAEDQTWATMPIYGWSIAEINMGIVCSCIPVAFVLFRGIAKKSSMWASHIWYNLTGGYRKATEPSGASEGQNDLPLGQKVTDDQKLPQVPKATMTGLRSFLGRFGTTKAETAQTSVPTDGLRLTMMSTDYDYHQQLRAGLMDRRPG